MAIGSRKQKSLDIYASEKYVNHGQTMWDDTFKGLELTSIVNDKLADLSDKPIQGSGHEKKKHYQSVLD